VPRIMDEGHLHDKVPDSEHLQLTDFKVFTLSRPTINLFVFGADQ
jgi:hypothetical protein